MPKYQVQTDQGSYLVETADAPPPAPPSDAAVPPAGSAVSRFASNFGTAINPFPALKHYLLDVPQAQAQSIQDKLGSGDYLGALATTLRASIPGSSAAPDAVAAQAHQFVQAYKDLTDKQQMPNLSDRMVSAAGHTAAGLLPLVGPAAANAGEQIGSGDVAGGLGSAAGLIASIAAPEAVKAALPKASALVNTARDSVAAAADASAEKNIATALNPTTKVNKALVQNKIAPVLAGTKPLLEGGKASATTATSLKDLQETAQANMETHGQAIDDIFDQHAEAGTKLSPKPIIAALDAEKQNYTVAGVPINEAYVAKLDAFQNQIQKVSDAHGGDIPLGDLRRIRQVHDEIVSQSKGGFALPPDAQSAVNASKTFGNAIRTSFADSVPELADENKQFSFWSDVDKVASDSLLRKTGQRAPLTQKIAEGVGTMAGAKLGGPVGALVGNRVGGMLGQFQNSTLWNTLAAGVKSKISNLLETGDEAGALALAKQNGVVPASAEATSAAAPNVSSSGDLPNATIRNAANPGTDQEGQTVRTALPAAPQDQSAGSGTAVKVPGKPGPGYQANYKLQELDDINGSHNGLTFAPNASYKLLNDRNYANAVNQGKVVNWSSPAEFDPKFHITDNPDATNGPVVTDSKGNVIGGNGRAMILQRVYNGNPKGAAAYRDLLTQKAEQFGIDPEAVASMKQPVLTREIPDSEFGPHNSKQDAVTDMNKVGTAALTPGERAIADSRRVSTATLDDLAARLDAKGGGATLADILDGQPGREVLKKLIGDGVVSPQEQAALTTEGGLTKAGRDRVSQLMIGRYFSDPAQLESIPAATRAKVERIAAPLAQVEAKPEWSLTPDMQSAVGLVDQAKKAGIPSIADFIKQDGLFGKDKYSPNAVVLAKALATSKSTDLTAAARQYAQDASYADKGQTLMGDAPTPAESFKDSFGALKSGAEVDAAKLKTKTPAKVEPDDEPPPPTPISGRGSIGRASSPVASSSLGSIGEQAEATGTTGVSPVASKALGDIGGNAAKDALARRREGGQKGSLNIPGGETGPHGPIFREYAGDWEGARDRLLAEKTGEAPGALVHTATGPIDVIYGDGTYGLSKIAARHPEVLEHLQEILDRLPEIEEKRTANSIQLGNDQYHALIRRDWKGNPKTWLLTAFEKNR